MRCRHLKTRLKSVRLPDLAHPDLACSVGIRDTFPTRPAAARERRCALSRYSAVNAWLARWLAGWLAGWQWQSVVLLAGHCRRLPSRPSVTRRLPPALGASSFLALGKIQPVMHAQMCWANTSLNDLP